MAKPLPPDDKELASVSGSIADDNQGAFQDVVRGTKRRCPSQASGSSEKTIITQTEPTVGLVVLFTPVDGDVRIDSINSVRLTSTLETLVPSCVIEVRYNRRKNLLAIDTRNGQTTRTLFGQTTLCGMKVRAFEPRGKASSVGIVRDIDSTLSDSAILGVLRSTVGIRNVRRIFKSTTIRVEFASPTLPEHVYVGLVRHGADLYVNNPIQCHRCGLFGHVAAVCKRSLTCLRCAQPHATTECKGSSTLCVNCKKPHETTSQQCPFWQAKRSVCRYRCENNVSFAEARAQVDKRTAERAAPRAEAATEMVVLTEKLQRRRRHSRRRQAEQPVADKQDPSSSLVAEAPKPMDTEPPPKEAPVLVSSGENNGRQSYKAALQNKPPSSSPPVQAGPLLPATQAPQSVGQEVIPSLPNPSTLTSSLVDSPWSKHPFTIYEDIPGFHGKSRHPSVASRALTEELTTSHQNPAHGQDGSTMPCRRLQLS
ncbi:hypothetical protein HPB47_025815 [Ixodes persulcatus]|uniref:Uncharacterized protein n=1 Tax=Ixodes persulcatus TaxID=34615 RepID=A0AC60Q0Y2_IXOPE|nr:hypothetical protein HPB47_025815 [Ixodes persulcatus]